MRLAIRLWRRGEDSPILIEFVTVTDKEIETLVPELAEKHAQLCAEAPTTIEIEFLDEPDPMQRYFRIGTDASRMVRPIQVTPNAG